MCLLSAAFALPAVAIAAQEESLNLVQPIADYKVFVAEKTDKLVAETTRFVAAVKSGDLKTAKELYASTRMNYETIEPVAELFNDLDGSLDSAPTIMRKRKKTLASSVSIASNTACG